jgi:long-chain acyl-CoA synthetase
MDARPRPWTRWYDPDVPVEVDVPPVTLADSLRRTAERFPDRPAVIFMDRAWTYRELYARAARFAGALRAAGVAPGDRVALLFPNVPDEVVCYYGAFLAGAVVVQLNPLGTAKDMEDALADSGATVLVALDALAGRFHEGLRSPGLRRIYVSRLRDALPLPLRLGLGLKVLLGRVPMPPQGFGEPLEAALAAAAPIETPVPRSPSDDALLQYTGGTTGTPKAARLTHRNLVANLEQCRAWLGNPPEGRDTTLLAVPCFHVYGMTVGMNLSVRMAQTMVLLARWDPGAAMRAIARYRPTQFPGVQMFYQAIVEHPKAAAYDLSSVAACLSGAGPLMRETQERFESLTGGRVVEGYGLTEASPVTHCNPLKGRRKPGTIGVPFPSTDAKIVDLETGTRELSCGEAGELCVKGPQVMAGYWNRPEETAAALRDGWLHTGDIAVMDEEGYFRIVDRKKEMIKTGGENVYPRDVEEVLFRHPAVRDAAVAGVPHPKFGEMVKAFVVLKPGASVTEAELIAHCRAALSGAQTPKAVAFRSALPRTPVGKLLRRALVEEEQRAAGA